MVESGDQDHSFVFNIMEIQPFHRAAAIQAISLDADRVSHPTLYPWDDPDSWQRRGQLCLQFACPFKDL